MSIQVKIGNITKKFVSAYDAITFITINDLKNKPASFIEEFNFKSIDDMLKQANL